MLFTSPIFLFVFLPCFLSLYYISPKRSLVRNNVALAASILFFAWGEPLFMLALLVGTFIDYKVSLVISPSSPIRARQKKAILSIAIILNISALIVSKYLEFLISEFIRIFGIWLQLDGVTAPNIPLLLGISFITFHRISYLVDSYKGRAIPPRNFYDCALYIFLFPQLIAGPIIRYHDIGAQIHARSHTIEGFLTGFLRFSLGLAKKMIIADPLGLIADKVFGLPPGEVSTIIAWGGAFAYTLQIYFDFSAYSDMAIGLGRMIGFRFPENFNRPYISKTVTEFWRRWHISLSNWMRLYLYIPLGGNRISEFRTYINLWVVFLFSGIWHGASWNFLVWGAYYGLFLSLERAISMRGYKMAIPPLAYQIWTLLVVMIGWIFFRSPSLEHAVQYILAMFSVSSSAINSSQPSGFIFGNRDLFTILLASALAFITFPSSWQRLCPDWLSSAWSETMTVQGSRALTVQAIVTALLLLLSAAAIVSTDYVPFLYFRF